MEKIIYKGNVIRSIISSSIYIMPIICCCKTQFAANYKSDTLFEVKKSLAYYII